MDYVFSKYDASRHPDLRQGKTRKEDLKELFEQTFSTHHYLMHGYQALEKITKQEFVEYYAHVSALIESDAAFSSMIENVWSLDCRDNPDFLPYAGSKGKVLVVDSHQRYMQDSFNGKVELSSGYASSNQRSKMPFNGTKESFYSGY